MACILFLAAAFAVCLTGCNGGRLIPHGAWSPAAASQEEKREQERVKAEREAAELAIWMLSWEDGPPVSFSKTP